jgi:hypothetical protein
MGSKRTEDSVEGVVAYSSELSPEAKCQQVEELANEHVQNSVRSSKQIGKVVRNSSRRSSKKPNTVA